MDFLNELDDQEINTDESIYVSGMSCRFPGNSNDLNSFWDNLCNRKNTVTDSDRFIGKVTKGSFLSDNILHHFDFKKFGISKIEAETMDVSQRLCLEVAYEALIDAGINDFSKPNNIGVYVGSATSSSNSNIQVKPNGYSGTGNANSALSGRISYTFNFTGPCFTLDTACSSSLVAIHNAFIALNNGDINTALIVGSNFLLDNAPFDLFNKANMLSSHFRCATFAEEADGYVRGEGIAAIVLKKKCSEDTYAYCKLMSAHINQDGKSANFTSPKGLSQEEVLINAIYKANLSPSDINYIETHGTGTPLGDPIEVGSISKVFGERNEPLHLGALR